MSDNIYKQNVYSLKQRMWHMKGTVGEIGEHALDIYKRMQPVEFDIRQFSIPLNGETVGAKLFGIIRVGDGKEVLVGEMKGNYKLTQPLTYCQIFDDAVGEDVETLGFLGTKGQRQFITWKLPVIDVHGDTVETYGFLAVGFDGKFGEKLFITNVRVVCNNTWSAAVANAENKQGDNREVYSGTHNSNNHERDLAIWMKYVNRQAKENVAIYQNLFRKMEETPVTTDLALSLFKNIYPHADALPSYYPDELRTEHGKNIYDYNQKQDESVEMVMELFRGRGVEITKTSWGAFNAVTEFENHIRKSKKDTTESILIGNRMNIMQHALNTLSYYVENK